jgi:hypothetical protein
MKAEKGTLITILWHKVISKDVCSTTEPLVILMKTKSISGFVEEGLRRDMGAKFLFLLSR